GRATRLRGHLTLTEKAYDATIRLGQSTVTDDAEGEITARPGVHGLERAALDAAVAGLTGDVMQVPAQVSAVKIDGRRAYRRVRQVEEVDLPARPVTVSTFAVDEVRELTAPDGTPVADLTARIVCSSGTYVRALARDLGAALGTGGHLTALRRTRVGPFTLDHAADLAALGTAHEAGRPVPLLPLTEACRTAFPVRELTERETAAVRYGQRIPPSGHPGPVAVAAPDGHVVALVEDRADHARPVLVLDPA